MREGTPERTRRGSSAAWRELGSPSRPHRTGLKVQRHASRTRSSRIPSSPASITPRQRAATVSPGEVLDCPTDRTIFHRRGGIGQSDPRFVSHPNSTILDNRKYQWSSSDVDRAMRGIRPSSGPARGRTGRARHQGGGGRGRARRAKRARRDFRGLCRPGTRRTDEVNRVRLTITGFARVGR